MKTYRCTYWIRTKVNAMVEAESKDEAIEICSNGDAAERTEHSEFDEDSDYNAELVVTDYTNLPERDWMLEAKISREDSGE